MPSTVGNEHHSLLGQALDLAGKTVVITGANSGIGEAASIGLARMGMNVVGVGRRTSELERVAALAAAESLPFSYFAADVTDESSMNDAMDHAVAAHGSLYGVIANAGIAVVAPAMDVSAEDFRSVVDTNLNGAFITARAAARRMTDGGAVVFTSSNFGKRGFTDWSSYNASKAAVGMLVETLAREWIPLGIRVNALAPGATLTAVNASLFDNKEFNDAVISGIPAGRIGVTEELVLPLAFLLSPRNEMVIGHTLLVDGGQSL